MKRLIVLGTLLFLAIMAFRVAERLSADALGLALGVLFGILAGIPTALLVLAAARRREETGDPMRGAARGQHLPYGSPYGALPQQPPVIILAGNGLPVGAQQGYTGYDGQSPLALPAPHELPRQRQFRLVGENDQMIDDFQD
jgi:hypothetical protein